MHPKFDPTGVPTHDLQIMNSTFYVLDIYAVVVITRCIQPPQTHIDANA